VSEHPQLGPQHGPADGPVPPVWSSPGGSWTPPGPVRPPYPVPAAPYSGPAPYPVPAAPYPGPPPGARRTGAQPAGALPRPVRVDPVPGTNFGVAYPGVPPTVSGLAIGAMVAGIGSVLVATLVFCFGLAGAQATWGVLVAGAFAVLAGLVGAAAVVSGLVAVRQIRRSAGAWTGRGMAVAGVSCGAGVGLTILGFVLAALLS
jgi:hypothetical protein